MICIIVPHHNTHLSVAIMTCLCKAIHMNISYYLMIHKLICHLMRFHFIVILILLKVCHTQIHIIKGLVRL